MSFGYGYEIQRKNVPIVGTTFTWNTNLADDAAQELYQIIRNDPQIVKASVNINLFGHTLAISVFDKFVPFREGLCHCFGVHETIYAVYKSTAEWDLWVARETEIKELRDEQELSRVVERQLVRAHEHYLIERCAEASANHNHERAYAFLCQRADLLKANNNQFVIFFQEEVFLRLAPFPASFCTQFLRKYNASWERYLRLCQSKAFWMKPCPTSELKHVCDFAIKTFPAEGRLVKEIVLFWERRKEIDIALEFCAFGIQQGLKDDTKGGFPFRFSRLEKKARTRSLH
jgi:hypothetical protein